MRLRLDALLTSAEAEHEDPAIGAFLSLPEADIRAGRHLQTLREDLARAMLASADHAAVDFTEDIDGETAL